SCQHITCSGCRQCISFEGKDDNLSVGCGDQGVRAFQNENELPFGSFCCSNFPPLRQNIAGLHLCETPHFTRVGCNNGVLWKESPPLVDFTEQIEAIGIYYERWQFRFRSLIFFHVRFLITLSKTNRATLMAHHRFSRGFKESHEKITSGLFPSPSW